MIKKIFEVIACLGLLLALMAALISCAPPTSVESEVAEDGKSVFVKVEDSLNYGIVYDRETKVMYAVSEGMYNAGEFTMLVNADGSPKLYEGEVE